jgi:hypothetical protein
MCNARNGDNPLTRRRIGGGVEPGRGLKCRQRMIVTPFGLRDRSAHAIRTLEWLHRVVEEIEVDVVTHPDDEAGEQLQALLELKIALDTVERELRSHLARRRTAPAAGSGIVIALRR